MAATLASFKTLPGPILIIPRTSWRLNHSLGQIHKHYASSRSKGCMVMQNFVVILNKQSCPKFLGLYTMANLYWMSKGHYHGHLRYLAKRYFKVLKSSDTMVLRSSMDQMTSLLTKLARRTHSGKDSQPTAKRVNFIMQEILRFKLTGYKICTKIKSGMIR